MLDARNLISEIISFFKKIYFFIAAQKKYFVENNTYIKL
jgi:nucleoside diphosphate kinase